MTQSFSRFSTLILVIWCLSCGQTAPLNTQVCTPTYSGSKLDIKVTHVSGEHYIFRLCTRSRSDGSPFSVYGASSSSGISDSGTINRYRLSHVADVQAAGDQFEVTFNGDLWFVIFSDVNSSGTFVHAVNTEFVRGDLSLAQ